MRRALLLAVIATTTLTACSSRRDEAAAARAIAPGLNDSAAPSLAQMVGTPTSTVPAGAMLPRQRAFDLCALLPPDSVSRVLRETVGKAVTAATQRPGGMCTYRDVVDRPAAVRVQIDIGRDRSAAAAGVTFLATRQALGARGIVTRDVPGLGDAAFGSSDTTGRYEVVLQRGAMTGKVSVSVAGAAGESLRPGAVELAKRTLAVVQ